jgi:hypothetical protein
MKKIFLASLALTAFAASILLFQMTSCTKSKAGIYPVATYPITGLGLELI